MRRLRSAPTEETRITAKPPYDVSLLLVIAVTIALVCLGTTKGTIKKNLGGKSSDRHCDSSDSSVDKGFCRCSSCLRDYHAAGALDKPYNERDRELRVVGRTYRRHVDIGNTFPCGKPHFVVWYYPGESKYNPTKYPNGKKHRDDITKLFPAGAHKTGELSRDAEQLDCSTTVSVTGESHYCSSQFTVPASRSLRKSVCTTAKYPLMLSQQQVMHCSLTVPL